MSELARKLKERRYTDRLTLAQAAEQSGVSAPTLSRIESGGTSAPDYGTVVRLNRWLGIGDDEVHVLKARIAELEAIIAHDKAPCPEHGIKKSICAACIDEAMNR